MSVVAGDLLSVAVVAIIVMTIIAVVSAKDV